MNNVGWTRSRVVTLDLDNGDLMLLLGEIAGALSVLAERAKSDGASSTSAVQDAAEAAENAANAEWWAREHY